MDKWPTPRASDANGPGEHGTGGMDLRTAVQRSEASSQASAASTSASSGPAGPDAGRSSTSPSASESSPDTGLTFTELEMFTTPTESTTALWATPTSHPRTHTPRRVHHGAQLANQVAEGIVPTASSTSISSPGASPASLSARLDGDGQETMIVGYAFGRWLLLPEIENSGGKPSLKWPETWPPSGVTQNGRAFRRRPLVPRTSATGSGSWPTPTVMDRPNEGSVRLLRARVLDGTMTEDEATAILKGQSPFEAQGAIPRWPTPTTRDYKDTGDSIANGTVPVNGLLGRAVEPSTEGGSLNPDWVELLMGYPQGWTDLGEMAGRTESPESPEVSPTESTGSEA